MSLAGKTILVVGGTGYVGSAILKQCVALGAKAVGVSRRGTPSKPFKGSDKVKWVAGSALFPEKFSDELAEADGVVHTVGTLIDSTVLDGKKPGEEGSYEQMNYETAKKVGDILNALQKDKKMVYISAAINLPFQPRYLAAKRAAEEYLNSLSNIRVTALRGLQWQSPRMEVSSLVEQVAPISTTRREGSRSSNKLQGAEERASHQPKEFACLPSFKDGVYIGMVTNRLPEGTGLFRSPAGILYVGEFSHGHFCGYGEMKKANRVYKGQFLNGEMSGIGCIKTKKSIAIAHFIKDKKHGVASISNLDRSQNMDGYYKEGETRGFCIVTDPVKQVVLSGMFEKTLLNGVGKEENTEILFVGNYRNNKKWGVGKVTDLHTQSTYSGSWKDDLKEGFGYLHDPDLNEDYEGLFSKNHKHGIGRLKCHSTKIAYIGTFEKDYYEGQGRLNFPNSFYLGNFRKSQRSGLGYERTNQEEIYFGYWLNDKRDGIGLDKNAEREYLGEWKRDLPHGRGLITMEGCTKAAIFDHGKPSTLLPDSMIYELEQQFSSLNFEKFIHPMSKYIEDLHYQIETYSQELTNQVEHIETRFESLDSKLKQDIQKLQDQNKQVQEGCNRMAQVLDSLFRSKGLDLRSLATIPYPELHTKTKSIEAQYSPKPEVTKLKSQGNLDSAEGSKPGRPTQNLQVNNPILNHSVRFDSVDHADDSARVTPSLTMNGRESPGRFEVYKQLQSAPKKPDQEKPAYREQALKRISMSEVTPYSNVFRKSKSPENKHGSLAHSRLTAVPSRFENKSKSRTRGAISTAKARATDKKNDAGSEDELTFISKISRLKYGLLHIGFYSLCVKPLVRCTATFTKKVTRQVGCLSK